MLAILILGNNLSRIMPGVLASLGIGELIINQLAWPVNEGDAYYGKVGSYALECLEDAQPTYVLDSPSALLMQAS
jgi:hypothetical protein